VRLSDVAKAVDSRRKEQQFGLANNAFGAAAGAIGTKAVYNQAKEKYYPEKVKAKRLKSQTKVADRAAARYRKGKHPFTVVQRTGQRIKGVTDKVPKKYVAPAAIAGGVGMQLVNAGADAQSAGYFARELSRKDPVKKSRDHVGRRVEVSKAVRTFDADSDRRHRLGVYEGLGSTGALVGAGGAVYGLKRQGVTAKKVGRKLRKHKVPLAALGAATASGTGAVAARRAYNKDRNQPWT